MLDRYGWSDVLQRQFESCAQAGLLPARVIIQQRNRYVVVSAAGELSATLSGKFTHDALEGEYPVAGDWVAVAVRAGEGTALVQKVLQRRGIFARRAAGPGAPRGQVVAANVDVALLVASLNADLSLRRIERYLSAARQGGVDPVIVLTKCDVCEDVASAIADIESGAIGVPVVAVSALTGDGIQSLTALLHSGKTAALLGSSGVGKSTLVNALCNRTVMTTRAIRSTDDLGRHTTTHRELVLLPNGALVLDTPGMRELGLWDADSGVSSTFRDVEELASACRFNDCRHSSEPGCAVRAALYNGTLDASRWNSFQKLQRELAFQERKTNPVARGEERKVWLRRHKNYRAEQKFRDRNE